MYFHDTAGIVYLNMYIAEIALNHERTTTTATILVYTLGSINGNTFSRCMLKNK